MASQESCLSETFAVLRYDPRCDVSNATPTDDDDTQYLMDPDLFHDILPQPFRRVNKLLTEIVDGVLTLIAEREAKILHEALRVRPPQYDTASNIEELGSVSCLSASADGKFVVVGLSDSRLVVISATHQRIAAEWKDDTAAAANVDVLIHITVSSLADNINLIVATDQSGAVHVFLHVVDVVVLAQSLNSLGAADASKKQSVSQCVVSHYADYIGLHVTPADVQQTTTAAAAAITSNYTTAAAAAGDQGMQTGSGWLEIYRVPREAWVKELDPVLQMVHRTSSVSVMEKLAMPASSMTGTSCLLTQDATARVTATTMPVAAAGAEQLDEDEMRESRSIPVIKFTALSLVVKLRPPSKPSGGITWSSAQQALKTVESTSVEGVLPTGLSHLVSKQHLQLRCAAFSSQHPRHAALLLSDPDIGTTGNTSLPTFHFLTSTKPSYRAAAQQSRSSQRDTQQTHRDMSQSHRDASQTHPPAHSQTHKDTSMSQIQFSALDQTYPPVVLPTEFCDCVAVCWSGLPHVFHYNLTARSPKELEPSHADCVWPMADEIVATASCETAALFAVALANNDIVLLDRNIGSCLLVEKINDEGPVRSLIFHTLAAPNHVQLIVESYSGQIYVIPCLPRDNCTAPKPVYVEIESEVERPADIKPFDGISQLLAVCCQDGRLYLHDIAKCQLVCELVLPVTDTTRLASCPPLQPSSFTVADGGRVLYAIALQREADTSDEDLNYINSAVLDTDASATELVQPPSNVNMAASESSNVSVKLSALSSTGATQGTSKQSDITSAVAMPTTNQYSELSAADLTASPKQSTSFAKTSSNNETFQEAASSGSHLAMNAASGQSAAVADTETAVPHLVPQLLIYRLLYLPSLDGYEFSSSSLQLSSTAAATTDEDTGDDSGLQQDKQMNTLESRVNSTLHARYEGQLERKERLERRWQELKQQMTSSLPTAAAAAATSISTHSTTASAAAAAVQAQG